MKRIMLIPNFLRTDGPDKRRAYKIHRICNYVPACLGYSTTFSVFCDYCGKHLHEKIGWKCSRCGTENGGHFGQSFLTNCRTCADSPTGIICPHCRKTVFLDGSGTTLSVVETTNAEADGFRAWGQVMEGVGEVLREATKAERLSKDIDFEITIEEKLNRLFEFRKNRRGSENSCDVVDSPKSAFDRKRKDLERFLGEAMDAEEIAERALREGEEKYQRNEHLLERYREIIERWRENHRS